MARRWWLNLTEPSIRDRVFTLVVAQTGWRKALIGSHQLLDDLGVDGDDAVEFFEAFEAEFQVDLEPLYRNWTSHFGPEGFPISVGLLMVAIVFVASVPAILLGLPGWAVGGLGGVAALVWLFGLRAWPLNRGVATTPITVDDLIRAAESGRWPEPPPSSASSSPSARNP